MKKFIYPFIVAVAFLLCLRDTRATHLSAAEITYAYAGNPNTYLLTFKAYLYCTPGVPPGPGNMAFVCYSSGSLNFGGTVALTLLPGSGDTVPTSPCMPATAPWQCMQEFIYQGMVTLPDTAPDWTFSWVTCCMNGATCNIPSPLTQGLLVTTGLNNQVAQANSSPVFTGIPVKLFCVNKPYFYDLGATDADGDSLVYSIAASQGYASYCDSGGYVAQPIPGAGSPSAPFPSANGVVMDPESGLMTFTPHICVFIAWSYGWMNTAMDYISVS